jgi:hypothetical protein
MKKEAGSGKDEKSDEEWGPASSAAKKAEKEIMR